MAECELHNYKEPLTTNIEYEIIKFKNGEIEKQSGELKAKWGTKS